MAVDVVTDHVGCGIWRCYACLPQFTDKLAHPLVDAWHVVVNQPDVLSNQSPG